MPILHIVNTSLMDCLVIKTNIRIYNLQQKIYKYRALGVRLLKTLLSHKNIIVFFNVAFKIAIDNQKNFEIK